MEEGDTDTTTGTDADGTVAAGTDTDGSQGDCPEGTDCGDHMEHEGDPDKD